MFSFIKLGIGNFVKCRKQKAKGVIEKIINKYLLQFGYSLCSVIEIKPKNKINAIIIIPTKMH